jgi:hypothetical protein
VGSHHWSRYCSRHRDTTVTGGLLNGPHDQMWPSRFVQPNRRAGADDRCPLAPTRVQTTTTGQYAAVALRVVIHAPFSRTGLSDQVISAVAHECSGCPPRMNI